MNYEVEIVPYQGMMICIVYVSSLEIENPDKRKKIADEYSKMYWNMKIVIGVRNLIKNRYEGEKAVVEFLVEKDAKEGNLRKTPESLEDSLAPPSREEQAELLRLSEEHCKLQADLDRKSQKSLGHHYPGL